MEPRVSPRPAGAPFCAEEQRIEDNAERKANWSRWGQYLSARCDAGGQGVTLPAERRSRQARTILNTRTRYNSAAVTSPLLQSHQSDTNERQERNTQKTAHDDTTRACHPSNSPTPPPQAVGHSARGLQRYRFFRNAVHNTPQHNSSPLQVNVGRTCPMMQHVPVPIDGVKTGCWA
jgi:hypothetical protein